MRKLIYTLILFAAPFTAMSQADSKPADRKELIELQTKEMVAHFKLDNAAYEKLLEANTVYDAKVSALEADTQMSQGAIADGIQYNMDLRNAKIKELLTPKQYEQYYLFKENSVYNR